MSVPIVVTTLTPTAIAGFSESYRATAQPSGTGSWTVIVTPSLQVGGGTNFAYSADNRAGALVVLMDRLNDPLGS